MRQRVVLAMLTTTALLVLLPACGGENERSKAGDPEAWKAENPMQLVLFGPPGAGKGTQAREISATYRIPHITTGGIFRDELQKESEIGISVKRIIDRGDLVPIEVVVYLVRRRLAEPDCRKGFILDGFPRTGAQLDSLYALLGERDHSDFQAVAIDVPDEALMTRLLARGRSDDTEATIRHRLEVYHERTKPVIERLENDGTLVRVDGDQEIESVFAEINKTIIDQWPDWQR